ncbi:MAG: hypothetical protein AABZ54_06875 [Bacteroidota bacterium]
MEFIRTSKGKNIKVIISIDDYKKIQRKIKLVEHLEKLNIPFEDFFDYLLVKKTRKEKSVSLSKYLKNGN